jgi:uncharacterized membrane protein YbaN (DUF454 family)
MHPSSERMSGFSDKVKRTLFVVIGTLFLIIGAIGILIPILPTTPFLLLAAACYLRGSQRIHRWMLNNRVFGEFIKNYVEKKGIKPNQKAYTILFLWLTIIFSIFYVTKIFFIRILLILIATAVSVHIIKLPTLKPQ